MLIYLPILIPLVAVLYTLYLEFFVIRPQVIKQPTEERVIRRKVTKVYMLGISRSSFLTILISLSAVLMAFNAVKISVEESGATRLHNQLSVRPSLRISFYNSPKPNFAIITSGMGPAIIKWAAVWVDEKPIKNWRDVINAINLPHEGKGGNFSYPHPGISLEKDSQSLLFSVETKEDSDYLIENYGRIKITICYCSIYGEVDKKQCWQASNKINEIKANCSEEPQVLFPSAPQVGVLLTDPGLGLPPFLKESIRR